ncbi:RagB/SusD family nutrient uptake outer membrane protein [Chryseobacterium oranimense]|uniref:RagB/SusD family nutrient uptake outer membrane protein n=1 Tax=Chryseobacterium oranimense TaxID=421058 RepID=UPI0021B05EDE|nr:RagB/SusD family nutrient uptake outer membrane protein [Chryseobacterium oranimense]UWX62308.1 RagB/SusD family nutrient uptake outer membrane protein [Chryseobacterium oranimense]
MKPNKNIFKKITIAAAFGLLMISTSCVSDLEQEPRTGVTSTNVFNDFANYPSALAKVYGGFASGGQESNGGNSDINGIDGNFSQYTRLLYTMQTLPTDEAVIAWNDGTLQTMHKMTWDSSNEFIAGMYYRIYTEIAFCNEFLRNVTDEKLASNNITGDNLTEAKYMRAEVRYLRALSYYYALDLYGNVPFVDESYLPGSVNPPQRITRANLFNYVESELLAVANDMRDARTSAYGRADKAAAWSLLARLYLNAGVYSGTQRNNDVITYTNKVIAAGYSLKTKYADLFLADNDKNNAETIFPIVFDGVHTQTSGGSTYMVHAAVGGTMPSESMFGINGGWGGLRTTKSYVALFTNSSDQRGNFYTSGQNLEINNLGEFTDGYAFIKYKNLTSTGQFGSDSAKNFCDADIPLFRLADIYLMYAEATLRGGNGNAATALQYINTIRSRAGYTTPLSSINLDFILDERGRELGWEMTRRTDLIRYGRFTTGSYLWPWKGGIKDGKSVEDFRNLYPIPAKDIIANPNLIQNPGY